MLLKDIEKNIYAIFSKILKFNCYNKLIDLIN